MIHEML